MRKLIEIKHEEAEMNMQEAEVNHCDCFGKKRENCVYVVRNNQE
jgi:hypothetical protein